jgi:hypothetical protein
MSVSKIFVPKSELMVFLRMRVHELRMKTPHDTRTANGKNVQARKAEAERTMVLIGEMFTRKSGYYGWFNRK